MLELHLNLQHYTELCKKRKSIYIGMFATTPFTPPDVSVFTNKSYVASKPTPATPAEGVIDLFHLHQLLQTQNIIISNP
jgi:hypothetical protein